MRLVARISLLPLLCLAAACGKRNEVPPLPASTGKPVPAIPAQDPAEVVASVDGATLTRGELNRQVGSILQSQGGQIPPGQEEQARTFLERRAVQSFIAKTLLANEAKRVGIAADEADTRKALERLTPFAQRQGITVDELFRKAPMGEEAARKEFASEVLIEKLVDAEVRAKLPLDDAALDEEMTRRQQAQAAARAEIEEIRRQLLAGTNFQALAEAKSACPSGKRGGDLGTFGRGQMVKPFETAAFSQAVGEIGPVVETDFGFHVIKVTARNEARAAGENAPDVPETVQASHILIRTQPAGNRDAVRKEMQDRQMSAAMQKYLEGLEAKAAVVNKLAPVAVPAGMGE